MVQGKWKVGILCRLQERPARLGDLRRLFPEASKKMLIQHLREMEWDGFIDRRDTSGKVPHVEYSLLEPRGVAVSRLLHFLAEWSMEYQREEATLAKIALRFWQVRSGIRRPPEGAAIILKWMLKTTQEEPR